MPSASGAPLQDGVTVAVDKRLIPFFSTLKIDGVGVRVAHDTGRNIKGNSIDVYIPNHAIASAFGIQYHEVWILRKGE
jgi:3D (Asp-Asp-Asp) domain-containing protein